ncbi:glycoside hydrolase family 18 protein [Apiospora arundinis]
MASATTPITNAAAASTATTAAAVNDHRVVVYYQTTNVNNSDTEHISMLPLVTTNTGIAATHVLIAAIHVVDEQDGWIRLNDFPPANPRFDAVWRDAAELQARGVTVTAMVGGAAQGSFQRLDGDAAQFERYYVHLRDFLAGYQLQGVDLDVEEYMSLAGIVRLIDRLRADFGQGFVITLAPVGAALRQGGGNLSGFSYFELEAQRGSSIDFYNAQFYFGWGSPRSAADYQAIVDSGFPAHKVTMGLLTSPANGSGFVPLETVAGTLRDLTARYPDFGGVAAWEYFNSEPGGTAAPWEWATWMAEHMRGGGRAVAVVAPTKMSGVAHRVKRASHELGQVARRWKSELWRWIK